MAHIDWFNPTKIGWRTAQLGYLVCHLRQHHAFRRLLALAGAAGLVRPGTIQVWKYLGSYLSLEASFAQRYRLLAHHYRFLLDRLSGTALGDSWATGFTLWDATAASGISYAIDLSQPTFSKMEGETRLCFRAGTETLWTLTFLIAPGEEIDGTAGPVLVLGALQGGRDALEPIRAATRDNARLRPQTMLMISAVAVAKALELRSVVAVPGQWSPVTRYHHDSTLFDRDRFWMESGAYPLESGWLAIPLCSHGQQSGKRALFKSQLSGTVFEKTRLALETAGSRS